MVRNKLVAQERAAIVMWALKDGHLCEEDIIVLTGLSDSGVRKLMTKLTRVVPIYRDDKGLWRRIEDGR